MIFILSAEMSLTDVFLVKIKIVSQITLPPARPPDAQCVSDKEAARGHLSQAEGSNNSDRGSSLPGLAWEGGVECTGADSWTCYRKDSLLPFPAHHHLHCQGRVLGRKQMHHALGSGFAKMVLVSDEQTIYVPRDINTETVSSSYWTHETSLPTTPNKSDLYVSGRHRGETQERTQRVTV